MSNLEFRNITPVDFPSICRICLIKGDLNRFEGYLSELFHHLTDIKVHPEDQLPGNICPTCTSKLQEISTFIDLSKLNDVGLRRVLNSEKHNDSQEYNEFHDENVMEDETSNEIKQEQSAATYDDGVGDKTNSDNESYNLSENEEIDNKNENSTYKLEKFPCSQCNKSFVTKSKLKVHLASHSKEGQFECKECGKKFKFSQNLVRHDKAVHKNVKPFKCEVCDKDILGGDLITHLEIHQEIESVNYSEESPLSPEYQETIVLEVHSDESSLDETSPTTVEKSNNDIPLCSICGKTFGNERSLKIHEKVHEKGTHKRFVCSFCGEGFSSNISYKLHLKSHKSSTEETNHSIDDEKKFHVCRVCGKKFPSRANLLRHFPIHSDELPYKCDKCDKSFKVRVYYKNHLASHSRKFLCTVCGRYFARKSLLDIHSRVHTGEKPYACEMCEKKFSQHSSLVKHMKFHTGERTFPCSMCEKAFKQSQHLKAHVMLKHTKEKPHACTFCGKCFTMPSTMRIHMRIHTGEKPYSCSICGDLFSDSSAMRRHQRMQHQPD